MMGQELILSRAKGPHRRIGIGASGDLEKVEESVALANSSGYGRTKVFRDAEALVRALQKGELDAAVRGSLDSNLTLNALKREFGLDRVLRMAILEPREGRPFFFAPVGVDEGWTVEQKVELITLGARLMRRMGVEPRVGVLSGGRRGDKGRHPAVDRTLVEAEEVVRRVNLAGISAQDCEILIEEAAKGCNMIIAPDGISGNLIFRTLHFLGGGKALGAAVLNLEKVFVDTSRAKASYVDSIALASALVGANR